MTSCHRALIATAVLAVTPATVAQDGLALALTWPGSADTGLELDTIGRGDFTVTVWFMAQYPYAYAGPIVDAGGIVVGVGDDRWGAGVGMKAKPPVLFVECDGQRSLLGLDVIDETPALVGAGTVLLADFDGRSWDGWRVEGSAFLGAPSQGGFLGQTAPCGWRGPGLVNSYAPDDSATGVATLGPFRLERKFIYMLVGGGVFPGRCGVNLLVEGAGDDPVRTATGRGSEWLTLVRWDVGRFRGRRAAIQIVDEVQGGWGHVLVDHIVHTDGTRVAELYPGDLYGTWQHLAVVRRDSLLTVHLNGEPIGEPIEAPGPLSGTLRFGRRAVGGHGQNVGGRAAQYYGLLDDVAVFTQALDVEALRMASLDDPSLLGAWSFDDRQVIELSEHGTELVRVSVERDDFADRKRLPVPYTGTTLTLPFPPGTTWWVTQGYDHRGGTHHGLSSFSLDLVRVDGRTEGAPVRAVAAGTIEYVYDETPDGAPGGRANIVVVRHADGTYMSYTHLQHGSATAREGAVKRGQVLGRIGDTGTGPGAFHLHLSATDLPQDGRHPLVTIPVAFTDYWISQDTGRSWRHVNRGVPETGQWVKRKR